MNLELTWGKLAGILKGFLVYGDPKVSFSNFCTDTRTMQKGQVFWALKGNNYDAHDFLDDSLSRGVLGWVIRKDFRSVQDRHPSHVLAVEDTLKALQNLAAYHRKRFSIPVVAIAGSNGKTTTKEMVKSILTQQGLTCANRGNFNNHIGLPLSLLELTPEHQFGVFELGATRQGEIGLLAGLVQPSIGVLTNISQDHLEFFGSQEGILKANTELIREMPPEGKVIFWGEDPFLGRLKSSLGKRGVSFGFQAESDVQIRSVSPESIEFRIGKALLRVPLASLPRFNQLNAAAAVAVGWQLGIDFKKIAGGVSRYHPAPMRFEVKELPSKILLILDAYNANPGSMRAGISSFCELYPDRKKYIVLGDMKELGNFSKDLHRDLGDWLKKLPLDGIYLVGPEMKYCYESLVSGSFFSRHYSSIEKVLEDLKTSLKPGAVFYFKASRAMQFEKITEGLCSITSTH